MFRFFRSLRQRLLTKNQFGRYLLYGFGEINSSIKSIYSDFKPNDAAEQKAGISSRL